MMPRTTRDYTTLELTQSAYDEIEAKLLAAGYEHLFAAGPGSAIELQGIAVTREVDKKPIVFGGGRNAGKTALANLENFVERSNAAAIAAINAPGADYCFMCDEMASAPCDRENCLRRANDRVRAELGLVP